MMEYMVAGVQCGHNLIVRLSGGFGRSVFTCVIPSTSRHRLHTHTHTHSRSEVARVKTRVSERLWRRALCRAASNVASAQLSTHQQYSVENYIEPTTWHHMLMNYFDISSSLAHQILSSDIRLKTCDVHILARNINTLTRYDVAPSDVRRNLPLLYRCPVRTEQYIAVLKELGILNLTADDCMKFLQVYRSEVSSLMRWKMLADDCDPRDSLLDLLSLPSSCLARLTPSSQLNNMTLHQVHRELSHEYLSWRLGCSKECIRELEVSYRLNKKSLTLQHHVLYLLQHHWDIGPEKVLQNGYLLTYSPVNMELIKAKVKTIAGAGLKELVSLSPRILATPPHYLQRVDAILRSLEISKEAVLSLPRIVTLLPQTMEERIRHLEQIPELGALRSHPRKLRLIMYYKKVVSRLQELETEGSVESLPSLNTLTGNKSRSFDRYIKVGNLRRNYRDVVTCLANHFNVETHVVRQALHQQCWGSHSTVINIHANLAYLSQIGYTKDQILSALDVVLYPPQQVCSQMDKLPHRPEAQPYSQLNPSITLQLLLYFLEKDISSS